MSNELTIVRFRTADDRTLPTITPESLSRITSAMQQLFVRAAQAEGQIAQVQFTFAVAPRKGSLEIVLAHALELRAAAHEPQTPRMAGTRRTTPAEKMRSDYAGWTSAGLSAAALIYTAVFGGQGLVEAFANDRPKPESAASDDPVDVVKFRLITAPQDRTQLGAHVRSLVQAAAESGAATVEIEILDEPAVLLFSEESRKLPSALTRRAAQQKADVELRRLREFDAGRYAGAC